MLDVKVQETGSTRSAKAMEALLSSQLATHRIDTALPKPTSQIEHERSIVDRIEALAIELRTMSDREVETVPSEQTFLALAEKIYIARRNVDAVFGMSGFAVSPGWDMMLDLYKANIKGKSISVTSACIGGACPPTTGLRWLQALEEMQLIARAPDHQDKRRSVVDLTSTGKLKVERALALYL